MEKIAIISDVHSNLEAFEAVIKRIDELGIRKIYSLGDTVGYGPSPVECTKLAMKHCDVRLMGNHEYSIRYPDELKFNSYAEKAVNWTRDRLNEAGLLDAATDLEMSHLENEVLFIHGSVKDVIIDYVRETDYEGLSNFDNIVETLEQDFLTFRLCFVGHNHQPFLATAEGFLHPHDEVDEFYVGGEKLYVSVGSVGQPRDKDPRACFVTFDGQVVRYHRVEYNVDATVCKVIDTDLPPILGQRLLSGK